MNANERQDTTAAAFLVARIGGAHFALATEDVQEIVTCDAATPLPWAPAWVLGLAHVGGRVLPLLDPARLLGLPAGRHHDAVVVSTPASACVLRVDEVLARVVVAGEALRHVESGNGMIVGEFEHAGVPVLVMDTSVLGTLLAVDEMPAGEAGLLGEAEHRDAEDDSAGSRASLVFRIGGALYAMPLTDIGEVIPVGGLTTIPGAPATVAGITLLRGLPLLVIDACRLLDVPGTGGSAALVLESGPLRIALQVDEIVAVEAFRDDALHALDDEQGDVIAVVHASAGRIVSLLACERLLNAARRQVWQPLAPVTGTQAPLRRRESTAWLETRIGNERFGIALDEVQRILPWCAPEAIDSEGGIAVGAIQVEGRIVPVLDPRLLGTSPGNSMGDDASAGAWVLVGSEDDAWALAVGEARRFVQIAREDIETLAGSNDGRCVRAIAHTDAALLSLVSFRQLCTTAGPA